MYQSASTDYVYSRRYLVVDIPGHYLAVALWRWCNIWRGIAVLRNRRGRRVACSATPSLGQTTFFAAGGKKGCVSFSPRVGEKK